MPEDLGSLMGSNFQSAPTTQEAPPKKKLRKVGDHFEDDQGNKFADEEGTQPIKADAKSSAMDAQSTGEFGQMLKDNPGRTGSLMTGQLNPEHFAQGGMSTYTGEEGVAPQGMSEQEKQAAEAAYEVHVAGSNKTNWFKRWMTMSDEEKKKYKSLADQRRGQG
jgi:hypothetical protein